MAEHEMEVADEHAEETARTAEQIAKGKARLLRGLGIYYLCLIGIGLAVWLITGSGIAGVLVPLGLLIVLPWVATAMRITYQKRAGLPVRGYWTPRPPSDPT